MKKKFVVYSYQDKVKHYTNILLDTKSSKARKAYANSWIENNVQTNYRNSLKRLTKSEYINARNATNKYLQNMMNSMPKKIPKKKSSKLDAFDVEGFYPFDQDYYD